VRDVPATEDESTAHRDRQPEASVYVVDESSVRDVPMTTDDDDSNDDERLSDDCHFTVLNDGTSKGRPLLDDGRGFQYSMKSRVPSDKPV